MTAHLDHPSFASAPALPDGGTLAYTDPAELAAAATDLGNLARATPGAVLRPGGPGDVVVMTGWCTEHEVPIKARGTGHTVAGQGLCAPGGVQIAMRSLADVHSVGRDVIDVDAGALLLDVVEAAAERGLRLRTGTPGYLRQTVGGALSTGAISLLPAQGSLLDAARELQVTGPSGELRWCSATREPELFHRVLGGMGEHGAITRARLDLVPMPSRVRSWDLRYDDIGALLADMRRLVPQADECYARWQAVPAGPEYHLIVSTHYDASTELAGLPAGLLAADRRVHDEDFLQHVTDVAVLYEQYVEDGWESTTKIWAEFFVPDATVDRVLTRLVPSLTDRDISPTGFGLIRPHRRHAFGQGSLSLPAPRTGGDPAELVYLVALFNDSTGRTPDPEWVTDRLTAASGYLRLAVDHGAVVYPTGSFQMSPVTVRPQVWP